MLATGMGEQSATQLIKDSNISEEKGRVTIACVNSPASTTLSGDEPAVDYIHDILIRAGVFSRKLKVESAYHSHHMKKVAEAYSRSLADLRPSAPREDVEFVSSVTGSSKSTDFGPQYWTDNLVSQVRTDRSSSLLHCNVDTSQVRFSDALSVLAQSMSKSGARDAANIFIEIGPHSALQGPLQQVLSALPDVQYTYVSPLTRGKNSSDTFSATTARLLELGTSLDLKRVLTSRGKTEPQVIADLFSYPWDHSVKYWSESRLSREHRMRPFPYHDLVGLYDAHSPIDEPRWRHHLSVTRLPWLRHHIVDGLVIFPGSGYTCMAIEAIKQLVQIRNPGVEVSKVVSRDFNIHRAIVVPSEESEGTPPDVEVQIVLSPSKNSNNSPWYTLRVLSLQQDGQWAEHVTGSIRAEVKIVSHTESAGSFGDEQNVATEEAFEALERIKAAAKTELDVTAIYAEHKAAGNDWGASFAVATEMFLGKHVALSKVKTPAIGEWMPHEYYQPHLIHPATLDATFHAMATLFKKQMVNAPIMPTTTEEATFTSDLISTPGAELIIANEIKPLGKTAARGSSWIFQQNPETGDLMLVSTLKDLVFRAVGEEAESEGRKPFERKTFHQVHWKPDPDFLTETMFKALMAPLASRSPEYYHRLDINEKAGNIYLSRVKGLPVIRNPKTAPTPHYQHLAQWILDWTSSKEFEDMMASIKEEEVESILEESRRVGLHEGILLSQIGQQLPGILDNSVNPVSLVAEDDLLGAYYRDGPMLPLYKQMVEYFEILTHKSPQMNILEIGAGAGSATVHLFNTLGDHGKDMIQKYCYTDISSSFFEQGKVLLDKWNSLINFKVLDISKDPADQGFELNQFDLVVASNVLYATPSINESLGNIRKLMKPGGRMLVIENHRDTATVNTVFGTLPG
jgi:acyl transferase domain-containing protein